MTTPSDDVAGLRDDIKNRRLHHAYPYQLEDLVTAAATQLDSLLKERDALQARVKELEEVEIDARLAMLDVARIQQERDEAYERAARVTEKEEPGWRGVCIAAEIRRLAAGPEKEG